MRARLSWICCLLLTSACPAGFSDLCDNGACDNDASSGDTGVDAPPGCDLTKDPKDSMACVDDSVGVFVSPTGNDGNPGTKLAPVKSISVGLGKTSAQRARLYICEGSYAEDVSLDSSHPGISIYGGWRCSDWTYSGNKPLIGKSALAFRVDGQQRPIAIEDLSVQASPATAGSESSIAVRVNATSALLLVRDELVAGNGADGANGTTTPVNFPAASALQGADAGSAAGAPATAVNCPAGGTTVGGKGGDSALGGDAGLPDLGAGQGGMGSGSSCAGGSDGNGAGAATDGPGAADVGKLVGGLWTPSAGVDGTAGSPGQGGGGGGGKGGATPGGGGGGGAGACGGAGGAHGDGGGGSIGILLTASTVTVAGSTITTGLGGNGGNGDAGQPGQTPGGHFGSSVNACPGGNGGAGGAGGAGGGGAGGISVGVLWQGNQPTLDASTMSGISLGSAGKKGTGGKATVNDGVPGIAQAVLQSP